MAHHHRKAGTCRDDTPVTAQSPLTTLTFAPYIPIGHINCCLKYLPEWRRQHHPSSNCGAYLVFPLTPVGPYAHHLRCCCKPPTCACFTLCTHRQQSRNAIKHRNSTTPEDVQTFQHPPFMIEASLEPKGNRRVLDCCRPTLHALDNATPLAQHNTTASLQTTIATTIR